MRQLKLLTEIAHNKIYKNSINYSVVDLDLVVKSTKSSVLLFQH